MNIKEIKAKTIIIKSNLPEADYVINPYVGCTHSCIYCYARFMKRFTGHTEPWGSFLDIKINAAELIPKNTKKYKNKMIFLSSVTDPYMPVERKYKITRKILKNLIPLEPHLGIQTKSDLVTRDLDLLKQFKLCDVGLTITTLDDQLRRELEPFTSTINKKIKALETLHNANINTYVFIGPIMPFLTSWKDIILKTKHCTDFYMFENLNVRGTIWNSIQQWLNKERPELLEKYNNLYSTKNNYWDDIEKEIKQFCKKHNIKGQFYFHP